MRDSDDAGLIDLAAGTEGFPAANFLDSEEKDYAVFIRERLIPAMPVVRGAMPVPQGAAPTADAAGSSSRPSVGLPKLSWTVSLYDSSGQQEFLQIPEPRVVEHTIPPGVEV